MSPDQFGNYSEEELALLGGTVDYPTEKEKASLLAFFNKILRSKKEELSKVSNLKDSEIIALNELRKGSIFAAAMELDEVAEFFYLEADAYLALADSRNGFLVQTAVTQKRETTSTTKRWEEAKKGFWGLKKK